MIETVNGLGLDSDGRIHLKGNPTDLLPGDLVLGGTYKIVNTKPAEDLRRQATELRLRSTEGKSLDDVGRATLVNTHELIFYRDVENYEPEQEQEHRLFYEPQECAHDEHEHYALIWEGSCRDVPKGMYAVVNWCADGYPPKETCEIVDTVYPTGAVIFESGRVLQSHPDREWVGWLRR